MMIESHLLFEVFERTEQKFIFVLKSIKKFFFIMTKSLAGFEQNQFCLKTFRLTITCSIVVNGLNFSQVPIIHFKNISSRISQKFELYFYHKC